ncbi:universal stress protein [Mycolicibacterium stellerae]|uniref:universal stress protein n=1 Tax=Mycolicibacterium stellerae TaxID=2358193 RepID=UPI000F0B84D0|nr:universal stress protein [Mycolicibacterium stellerae]
MTGSELHRSVVVGIDGSEIAVRTAEWAVDEAVSRNVPLRLVYVTKVTHPSFEEYEQEMKTAEAALRAAQSAVEALGQPVKVETVIEPGLPGVTLVTESRDADLLCVGSVGIGRYARAVLGSTATEVAEHALCPVVIIRTARNRPESDINWVVVTLNDLPENAEVVEQALREASLRKAPVLAVAVQSRGNDHELERRVDELRRRHPDLHVYPVATDDDIAHFLEDNDERVQLTVIGPPDVGELARIVGPHGHPLFRHAESSVLVVR